MDVRARFVLVVVVYVACTAQASAQPGGGFFSSSPGKLATSHAHLDDAAHCNACHVDGTRVVSNKLCLDCHDHNDLRARIDAGKGYHATVRGKACITCHKEHKGPASTSWAGSRSAAPPASITARRAGRWPASTRRRRARSATPGRTSRA
jgi:hypothetical protein